MEQHLLYLERELNKANSRIIFLEFIIVLMYVCSLVVFVCVYPTYCEYRDLAEKFSRLEEYQFLSNGYVDSNHGILDTIEQFLSAVCRTLLRLFGI